ncbi:MAG: MipA/OmpV family protein [Maricaulaceae bacterium]
MRKFTLSLYSALLPAILLSSTPALAQIGDWFPDEALGYDVFKIPEKKQKTYIDVGGGLVSLRAYQGSTNQVTKFYPFASAEYKGRWFANPFNGVGFYPINTKKINLSASATYNPGRKASDTPFDTPEFDLDPGLSLKASGRYRLKYLAVGGTVRLPVMGEVRGVRASARAATLLPIGKQVSIVPSVSASFESGKRLSRVYGINAEQSLVTGTPELSYNSGFSGYSASLAGYWRSKDKKIQIIGGLTYRELMGDITDSPLTPDDNSYLAGLGFARRY